MGFKHSKKNPTPKKHVYLPVLLTGKPNGELIGVAGPAHSCDDCEETPESTDSGFDFN